ncbi:MAG: AAA family ATPase [Myxococcales bacterium]|nr:AAA family ATPase [Myxococcales bacterium]
MSISIPLTDLPQSLDGFQAVEAAYPTELTAIVEALRSDLPVLIECDKGLTPWLWRCVRDRIKAAGLKSVYLNGRPDPGAPPNPMAGGIVSTMIGQLRDAVRGATEQQVIVIPHLDLLVTSQGGLTAEAREVVPLLYENPNLVWVGFKDPSMPLPKVIETLFPRRVSILGISRDRLRYLITEREARKFGRDFNPYGLYTFVSGLHAARLRRVLPAIQGEDFPLDPRPAYDQLRQATQSSEVALPNTDLELDIGGYAMVKARLRSEILDLLAERSKLQDAESITRIEQLIPRGMIFWGPPGTGKTLFAKAMATALGAAVTIISGPELKSRWVGESEERIRQVFVQARQAAPAIIVFDELDSFATARGTYTGSGVEHSMVNQLLTEMDGFRRNEMVFVVGTTNFPESLDPALLRPGRFEFQLHIPFPDGDDRRAILTVYDKKLQLKLTDAAMEYAVRRTAGVVEGGTSRFSGDHLQALGRSIARRRIRERLTGPTDVLDVEHALTAHLDLPKLTATEERVVATHESGHAICALHCEHAPPIERISIRGDLAGALGFVQYGDQAHKHVTTRKQLIDHMCVLFGGREAEELLLTDLSLGSAQDLERATGIARGLIEELGMGSEVRVWPGRTVGQPEPSETGKQRLEAEVLALLAEQRERARVLVRKHRRQLEALRDLLLEKKVLDRAQLASVTGGQPPSG